MAAGEWYTDIITLGVSKCILYAILIFKRSDSEFLMQSSMLMNISGVDLDQILFMGNEKRRRSYGYCILCYIEAVETMNLPRLDAIKHSFKYGANADELGERARGRGAMWGWVGSAALFFAAWVISVRSPLSFIVLRAGHGWLGPWACRPVVMGCLLDPSH